MGSPSVCIRRLAQPKTATERVRSRISRSERPLARRAVISACVAAGGQAARFSEYVMMAWSRGGQGGGVGGEDGLDHAGLLGELDVAASVHRHAVDAAVDDGGGGGAQLAFGAGKAAAAIHDAVEQRRALAERFRIMGEDQDVVADLGVGGGFLQRLALGGGGGVVVHGRDVGAPDQGVGGEGGDGVAHGAAPIRRRPAMTRTW